MRLGWKGDERSGGRGGYTHGRPAWFGFMIVL